MYFTEETAHNNGGLASDLATKYYGAHKSSFILHPSATPNLKTDWIRPNDIDLLKKDVEDGNKFFRNVYKSCTSLSEAEIDKILYSNDSTRYFLANEAKKIKLSLGETSGITPTPVSYYIINSKNGESAVAKEAHSTKKIKSKGVF